MLARVKRAVKTVGVGVALLGQFFKLRPPGVRQAEDARNFVERFASSVVARAAEQLHLPIRIDVNDVRMAARSHQADKRRVQIFVRDEVRGNMAFDVVHGNEGLLRGVGKPLGVGDPHEQRADQSGAVGHRHGVDIINRHICLGKRFGAHRANLFYMAARSDLRHDAAVDLVQRDLREYHGRKHFSAVFDDGGGSFVAGAFHRKNHGMGITWHCPLLSRE